MEAQIGVWSRLMYTRTAALTLAASLLAAPALAQEVEADAESSTETSAAPTEVSEPQSEAGADEADEVVVAEPQREYRSLNDPIVEKHDHWYVAFGAGYRGTVMPAFMFKPFVQGVPTTYFNAAKISADFRKNGFSIIPSIGYQEYGTGEMLLLQRGKNEQVNGNWAVAESNLKSLNLEVELLWSSKVHRTVDIEYGLGVGVGTTFGDLGVNWVYGDPNGAYRSESGRQFSRCESDVNPVGATGCTPADHSNAQTAKVGGFRESSWFNGGSKPSFLPWLTPEVGVRVKPHKNVMARLGIGWGLYGPWFGISGFYFHDKPIARSQPSRGSDIEVIETSE